MDVLNIKTIFTCTYALKNNNYKYGNLYKMAYKLYRILVQLDKQNPKCKPNLKIEKGIIK